MTQYASDVEAAKALHQKYKDLKAEIGKVIIGQHDVVDAVLMSIFAGGHTLLVGVP
jgi:MoxR-like ATPase